MNILYSFLFFFFVSVYRVALKRTRDRVLGNGRINEKRAHVKRHDGGGNGWHYAVGQKDINIGDGMRARFLYDRKYVSSAAAFI